MGWWDSRNKKICNITQSGGFGEEGLGRSPSPPSPKIEKFRKFSLNLQVKSRYFETTIFCFLADFKVFLIIS